MQSDEMELSGSCSQVFLCGQMTPWDLYRYAWLKENSKRSDRDRLDGIRHGIGLYIFSFGYTITKVMVESSIGRHILLPYSLVGHLTMPHPSSSLPPRRVSYRQKLPTITSKANEHREPGSTPSCRIAYWSTGTSTREVCFQFPHTSHPQLIGWEGLIDDYNYVACQTPVTSSDFKD